MLPSHLLSQACSAVSMVTKSMLPPQLNLQTAVDPQEQLISQLKLGQLQQAVLPQPSLEIS
jgi:hypothetical protein